MKETKWIVCTCILLLVTVAGAMTLAGMFREANHPSMLGSGEGGTEPIRLVWLHHFGEDGSRKWIDSGIRKFQETHPGVTVTALPLDGGEYMSMLRMKVATDEMPDLYMLDNIHGGRDLIESGYATDLTGRPFLDRLEPEYLYGSKTEDGRVWTLPIDANGLGVTYNKDAFTRAGIVDIPKTWSEFLDVCRRLEAQGIMPIAAGYKESWTLFWDLGADFIPSSLVANPALIEDLSAGATTFEQSKAAFAGPIERLGERFRYVNANPFETSWDEALAMVADGRAAMIIGGTWSVDGVRSKRADAEIGLFPLPVSDVPGSAKFAMKATGGIVVNPLSRHADLAMELLELFAQPEMGRSLQENKKGISVVKDIGGNLDPALLELHNQYIKPGRTVDWSGVLPDFISPELSRAFHAGIADYLLDPDHDVDAAIRGLDEAFDGIRKPQGNSVGGGNR
ncbi:carbohydrate ABC transporter substrate-binding protein [Paenibacillus antri]|uniref:Carbohydrate ABC transporter substrate-binding protein n=1 Tax=Paenibacillus antri TaxID=2582848 RepID=A0A5R9GDK8_9BACL|nr:ABC transporter substrate-binding protein [Paenibacillus antri]TLS53841.1 carbohydrate ABC transporter substrate-binding protein [Paenibacillus antri]